MIVVCQPAEKNSVSGKSHIQAPTAKISRKLFIEKIPHIDFAININTPDVTTLKKTNRICVKTNTKNTEIGLGSQFMILDDQTPQKSYIVCIFMSAKN